MDILDNLVLPQSLEHLQLLNYMLMLVLFLFVPFISIVFGGTIISLFFKRKGERTNNSLYLRFSRDVIEAVTINSSVGIILGVVPLFTAVLILAQILSNSGSEAVGYALASFGLVTIAVILINSYRNSLKLNSVFSSLSSLNTHDKELESEIKNFEGKSKSVSATSGRYGLILLFIGLWFYVATIVSSYLFNSWEITGIFQTLFSWKVLSYFIFFILLSLALTGAAVLFRFFYWDSKTENMSDEYLKLVKNISVKITFISSLLIPVFLLINLFTLPENILTGPVFTYTVVSLLLFFLGYHFLYLILQKNKLHYSIHLFVVLIFAVAALIIKDQIAMKNSTEEHAVVLNNEYQTILADLRGEGGTAEINGQDLFQVRCSSCHKFDQKLVGPPYNEVLPKYEGNVKQLISFIRNPVKVNPEYPPMPNPGLKPNEAKAVAEYLLESYKQQ